MQKQKYKVKCKYCGEIGHNQLGCQLKNSEEEVDVNLAERSGFEGDVQHQTANGPEDHSVSNCPNSIYKEVEVLKYVNN